MEVVACLLSGAIHFLGGTKVFGKFVKPVLNVTVLASQKQHRCDNL